mmetsp:Transcript_23203/g.30241  ORF Transcript_23203/g.30241 Transcript_23203/m.30241 type:complete len:746 (-) Transcript_23203:98-2335(-)
MGKKGGKKFMGKRERWDSKVNKEEYKPNEKWIAYYKAQNIVNDEQDWNTMVETFMRPLPASLRINFDCPYGERLKQELLEFCATVKENGVGAVRTLDWFPDGRGFQLGLDRNSIRKSQDPSLRGLHKWLIHHTEGGMLTRQEAVSMIPPCVLQVEPHHLILDMCASPGSKTTQMLEVIQNSAKSSGTEPRGMVIANDCDTQRAYMLAHQCKRINSPALVITTHLGQFFPNITPKGQSSGIFDRVLADVPCSGDGTIRKQPNIMATWGCHGGQALYPLQLDIAMRGVGLCKVGGLLVYSTCSLNPIENEAVVATLLKKAKGALVLEETKHIIPELKRRDGLSSWHVFEEGVKPDSRKTRKLAEKEERKAAAKRERGEEPEAAAAEVAVESEEPVEVETDPAVLSCTAIGLRHYKSWEHVPQRCRGRVREGMFPPPIDASVPKRGADGSILEGREPLNLDRCIRCVPQDEDTGGFFVCLLRKVCELDPVLQAVPTEPEGGGNEAPLKKAKVETSTGDSGGDKGGMKPPVFGEHYCAVGDDVVSDLRSFFGLSEDFPSDQLYTRNEGACKTVTFLTKTVKNTVIDNDQQARLKIVLTGLKMFEKNSANALSDCKYRMVQESVYILEPFLNDSRKVIFSPQDLAKVVGRAPTGILHINSLEVEQKIQALSIGAFLAITVTATGEKLIVVCWRGRNNNTINVMCSKESLSVIGQRLVDMGVEVSFPETHKQQAVESDTKGAEEVATKEVM